MDAVESYDYLGFRNSFSTGTGFTQLCSALRLDIESSEMSIDEGWVSLVLHA